MLASLINKPGKSGIDGSQVQDMYWNGQVEQINDYCRCDVLDTYFVFLRCQLLLGRISAQEEQSLTDHVRTWLQQHTSQSAAYSQYLQTWDRRTGDRVDILTAMGR
jgi:predicted PolB exonuclease-like 3'-5' exonuclease